MKKAILVLLLVAVAVYAVLDPPRLHFNHFAMSQSSPAK
jgi:hypothetical protein